ncbi:hypothetical protein AAMO2058_001333000 [Amorphochlora amoebiformis]
MFVHGVFMFQVNMGACGNQKQTDEEASRKEIEKLQKQLHDKDVIIKAQSKEIEELKSKQYLGHVSPIPSPNKAGTNLNQTPAKPAYSGPGGGVETKCKLTILHFNDVYNIEPMNEYQGGAARFMAMPPVLNKIGVHVACYGNHDFDFGEETAKQLTSQTKFPWLLSNIVNKKTKLPLGDAKESIIITHKGLRVGIFAAADDWTDTMPMPPDEGMLYIDYVQKSKELVKKLKSDPSGAPDLIIALTHARLPSDRELCLKVEGIDLVLGGHDHLYHVEQFTKPKGNKVQPPVLVKSGSDFRDLSSVRLYNDRKQEEGIYKGGRYAFHIERCQVGKNVTEDPEMLDIVEEVSKDTEALFNTPLGTVEADLDARFKIVRSQECAVGNLLADVARRAYDVKGGVDLGYIVGGTIRSDSIYKKGEFSYKKILRMLPFQDNTVVITLTGQQFWDSLEHGLSSYPKLDGRFPHVSGCALVFDPSKGKGSRVVSCKLLDSDGYYTIPIDPKKRYTIATREFLFKGGDGYSELAKGEAVVDEENGHPLSFLLRNFFWKVRELNTAAAIEKTLGKATIKKRASLRLDRLHSVSMLQQKIEQEIGQPDPVVRIHPRIEGRLRTVEQQKEVEAKEKEDGSPEERSSEDYSHVPPFSNMVEEKKRGSIIRQVVEKKRTEAVDHRKTKALEKLEEEKDEKQAAEAK